MKTVTIRMDHDGDTKSLIFVVIDSANHEPCSGKSALMNQMMKQLVIDFAEAKIKDDK